MKQIFINILKALFLLLLPVFFLGGLFFSIAFLAQSWDFQIGKVKYLTWAFTGVFSGVTILISLLDNVSRRITIPLFGASILLLILSVLMWNRCPDLKQELSLPQQLQGVTIFWDKKIVYENAIIEGCVASLEADRILQVGLGPPYFNPNRTLTPIPENTFFTIDNYFKTRPYNESGDGFFGTQPETYFTLKDDAGNKYLVSTYWLRNAHYITANGKNEIFDIKFVDQLRAR